MLITIVGKRGKGKTTLAKNLIKNSSYDRIFLFDFIIEYNDILSENIYFAYDNLHQFCKLVWDESSPALSQLVVFDEIDSLKEYFGQAKVNRWIGYLYRYGRHKNIDAIAVSRRFYDLPVIVRALTDKFHLFQITEERDINYLRRYIDNRFISKLISLEDWKYINIEF